MEVISKVRKVGGSLMIRIPRDLVGIEPIQEGQLVKVRLENFKQSGFGILKGMKIEKEHIKGSDFE